ncbi:hypothetical protein ACOMHN_017875 [Nucella lapillus]
MSTYRSNMPAGFEDDDDCDDFPDEEDYYSQLVTPITKGNLDDAKPDTATNGSVQPAPSPWPFPNYGRSSLDRKAGKPEPSISVEDLRMAITRNNIQAVTQALDQGMDVNVEFPTRWTPLMYAGNCGYTDIFRLLLERGANPSYHAEMHTVLMATCRGSRGMTEELTECVQLLIDKGADINAQDRYHTTALMYAAREGQLDIARLLLDKGADMDCQDFRGLTALSWATQREKLGVVKLLLERGADRDRRHIDGLTAIDLCRGREEVVWLFEGKVGAAGDGAGAGEGDVMSAAAAAAASQQDVSKGCGYLKYGDLEMFLYGLQLGQFHDLFTAHLVDFPLLLTMTEEDLVKMGITQVGVRLKLMEGIAAVHKRNWETSSLVPIRIKSQVKCPDAIAIVANLSLHLRYVSSSVTYVKDNVRQHPQFLALSEESADPKQLLLHAGDALKNVGQLQKELTVLHSALTKEMANGNHSIQDRVPPASGKRGRKVRLGRLALMVFGLSAVALATWNRDSVVESAWSLVSRVRLRLA